MASNDQQRSAAQVELRMCQWLLEDEPLQTALIRHAGIDMARKPPQDEPVMDYDEPIEEPLG